MPNRTLSSECVYALASNKHISILRAITYWVLSPRAGNYSRVRFYPETWSKYVRSAHSSHRTGYFWVVCAAATCTIIHFWPLPKSVSSLRMQLAQHLNQKAAAAAGVHTRPISADAIEDAHNILFTCAKEQPALAPISSGSVFRTHI
jgi:hypothetical protein